MEVRTEEKKTTTLQAEQGKRNIIRVTTGFYQV